MKVVIIFPPFAHPTYIPLGMASLKAYINNLKLDDVEVKCIDLNLKFHNNYFPLEKEDATSRNTQEFIKKIKNKTAARDMHEFDTGSKEFIHYINKAHKEYDEKIEEVFTQEKTPPEYAKELVKKIIDEKPDIIGFSMMLSVQWNFSALIATVIKEVLPKTITVFGGSTFATEAEEKFRPQFMDYLIYGEAESSFEAIIRKAKGEKIEIPSCVSKEGITKRKELTGTNLLQPDFSDYELTKYYMSEVVLPVYSSRSCVYKKCTYCIHYATFHCYKEKSVEQFVDELEDYNKQGIQYFNIVDEMILPNKIKKMCERIKEKNLDIFWHCTLKPMKGFDKELSKLMYETGCRMIFWGVETGSQEMLDKMKKGAKVEQVEEVLQNIGNARIKNYCLLIIGFPGETEKELQETKDFLSKNKEWVGSAIPSPFFLYRGTHIFNHPEEYGITKIHDKDKPKRNYEYNIQKGWDFNQIILIYQSIEEFFSQFNKESTSFDILRDEGLIYYAKNN